MQTEKMYELAFQYRAERLWTKLYDTELFAVRLTDGEIGYCTVMGMLGEHIALGLYVGAREFECLRQLLCGEVIIRGGEPEITQECLQCSFEKKDFLDADELAAARAYARASGRRICGKNAYPKFVKHRAGRLPWHFDSELDGQRICDALSAALAIAKRLETSSKDALGLHPLEQGAGTMPLLWQKNGVWNWDKVAAPEPLPQSYPAPVLQNDLTIRRLRRLEKRGTWEYGTMEIRVPVYDDPDSVAVEAPCFPMVLAGLDRTDDTMPPLETVTDYAENAGQLLETFASAICESGRRLPRQICVADARTHAFFQDFCDKTGVQLCLQTPLPDLEETLCDLREHMESSLLEEEDFDELEHFLALLMQMEDEDLSQLPPSVEKMLRELMNTGALPPELEARLRRLL